MKCKQCNIEVAFGYNTPLGFFCNKCWEDKDVDTKNAAFELAMQNIVNRKRVFHL